MGFSHRCSCTKRLHLLLLLGVRMQIISLLGRHVTKLVCHPTRGGHILIKVRKKEAGHEGTKYMEGLAQGQIERSSNQKLTYVGCRQKAVRQSDANHL